VLLLTGLGIAVRAARIEGSWVCIGGPHDAADPGDAGRCTAGVIEEKSVSLVHRPQEIAGLIIAHPVPACSAHLFEISNGKFVRFGLHQPVRHATCFLLLAWKVLKRKIPRQSVLMRVCTAWMHSGECRA